MSWLLEVTPSNITTLPGYTFSGPAGRTYVDANGVVQTAAANKLRNAHYIGGERTILLEGASTNKILDSEDFSAWTPVGTPTVVSGAPDPTGGTGAYTIGDDDGAAVEWIILDTTGGVTATSATYSIHLKQGTADETVLAMYDLTAGAWIHRVQVDWTAGVPSLSTLTGSGTLHEPQQLGDGFYRVAFSGTSINGNTIRSYVYPAGNTLAADTGTTVVFGHQLEGLPFPTSYIPTAGSAVTRNADSLSVDYGVDIAALTSYVDCVSQGFGIALAASQCAIEIDSSTALSSGFVHLTASGVFLPIFNNGTDGNTFAGGSNTAACTYGDTAEICTLLYADGSIGELTSVNGAAVVERVAGSAPTDGLGLVGWPSSTMWIGNRREQDQPAYIAIKRIRIAAGVQTMATMRSDVFSIARAWRLRIHAEGTTTPADGTVEYTFDAEVMSPPALGGQQVRILDGRADSQPWQVKLLDAADAVTAILGDANDRAQLGRRIVDFAKTDDGGATHDLLATGRLDSLKLDQFNSYVLSITDERMIERATTLFASAASTTSLWGPGFVSGSYGPFANLPLRFGLVRFNRIQFIKDQHSNNATIVKLRPTPGDDDVPQPVVDIIEEDVKAEISDPVGSTATTGSYRTLRLLLDGETVDREILGVVRATAAQFYADPNGNWNGVSLFVYDPGDTFPTDWTAGYLYTPLADPTEDAPLHIESTPGALLQAIYDGTYSGGVGPRYDSTAMTGLQFRLRGDGLGTLRWRVKATENMATWLEDNIYKPFGIVPLLGVDGALVPSKVYPSTYEISDPDALHEFTESNSRLLGWRYATDEQVSVVRATYPKETQFSVNDFLDGDKSAVDLIDETDQEHEVTHDTAGDGDRVHELSLRGFHDKENVERFMAVRAREIFEMFGDGPLYCSVWGGSDSASTVPGNYVIVDHSAMPSFTGQRGDSRLCFVLSRSAQANGYIFDLIEVGPSLQPLAAPTVSVVQATDGATVTFSGVPAGAQWELRIHEGDEATQPGDSDAGWRIITTGTAATYTIGKIKHGVTVWFQARARKEGRISSDWGTADSLTITALTAPSSLTVVEQGGTYLRATFTAGESLLPTEVFLEGARVMWLDPGSTSLVLRGLTVNTTYNSPGLQVRHVDPQSGAVSAFSTATFTTSASAETAPDYVSAVLLIGESG